MFKSRHGRTNLFHGPCSMSVTRRLRTCPGTGPGTVPNCPGADQVNLGGRVEPSATLKRRPIRAFPPRPETSDDQAALATWRIYAVASGHRTIIGARHGPA